MELLQEMNIIQITYALFLVGFGYFISRWISAAIEKSMNNHFNRHQTMIARRLMFYTIFLLFIISALHQLGFKLSVLLGAAGIFTVAIGFASQTAASNLVSGIFLLFERPFKVGDLIEVGSTFGYVEAIDLLSTKVKTVDNILVRLPNETLIKSAISNLSYFKTRRGEIIIGVAYDCDVDLAKKILLDLAQAHELVLKKPEASVIINQFADSAINLKFTFWTKTADVFNVRNELREQIKQQFDKEKIEIPFPQLHLHQA